jgi:hypothetical protein
MKSISIPCGMVGSPVKKTNCIIKVISYLKYSLFYLFVSLGLSMGTFAWSIEVTQGPSMTMNPNGVTPLAGVVELTTDVPTRAMVTVSNGTENWIKEFSEYQTVQSLPIVGLKADSTYSIEITVTDEAHNSLVLPGVLQAVTLPLPVDFPNISVIASTPARMEPGYTLLDKFSRSPPHSLPEDTPDGTLTEYSMILDNMGEVVWYSTVGSRNMKQLLNGNISYRENNDYIEMDLLGNELQRVHLEEGFIHHDVFLTANGTFLSLSIEGVQVDDYPTSYSDPNAPTQSTTIRDDPVVEYLPDGSLLNTWYLSDMLDQTRIGFDSLKVKPNGSSDWAHANAVMESSNDDSIIVSIRNQDAVVKFSRSTGALKWILGNHDNWAEQYEPFLLTPVGSPFEWQYHQHAPMITPSGTLLLFDNGNNRASPFDGRVPVEGNENYSRAVEYAINEETMEVQQIWEFGTHVDQRYYSTSVGDADWMDITDNILITYGNIMFVGGVDGNSLGMGGSHTRIVEVDRSMAAEKLFEVVIYNTTPGSKISGYRSERIPDLYPRDTDKDGVPDYQDNCVLHANGPLVSDKGGNIQLDTDGDGFGNICDADLNNDNQVNSLDLGLFKQAFFITENQSGFDPDADFNGDRVVNSLDLGILKALFSSQSPVVSASAP